MMLDDSHCKGEFEQNMRSAVVKDRLRKMLGYLHHGMTDVGHAALDFVYPPACLLCTTSLATAHPPMFCTECRQALAPLVPDSCVRCGAP
ncbi:MAG: hypothetical protein KDA84_28185, partial [Planctomycetaceae bacterium]|nr:hypothetical protein [Planctomycetaceae bacterium]